MDVANAGQGHGNKPNDHAARMMALAAILVAVAALITAMGNTAHLLFGR